VTALIENLEHVCCRYRLAAFRPALEQAGHTLHLEALPRHWWSRLRLFRRFRNTDLVILQRKLLQPWQFVCLRQAASLLVYDFDDAVFLRDSYAAKGLHSLGRLRRFTATVRAADAVIAGNAFLSGQAAAAGADRAYVVPTCVNPDRYPVAERGRSHAGVELVWIGSSSTLNSLESIRPLLENLGRREPALHLKVICDRFLYLEHLPVHACPWTETGEAAELAAADIGISWLPSDSWSRGKCGLKVLQYMAAGLPVVANPVGVQADLVRPGENGFLAETPAQWVEAVSRLAHDPELRRRMGQAGRRRVEMEFSVRVGAARWLALLDDLGRRRRAA
jgi:glycosyltransferase involved in cell wall biosynthesis